MTFIVGLTGGIGSGKTLISDYWGSLGVTIVDTDLIARQIVEPGRAALADLATEFGQSILHDDGTLNRDQLRELAFASSASKQKLDAITHPAIRQETMRQVTEAGFAYCVVVIPLLTADSAFSAFLQRVATVSCDTETRIQRVMKRNDFSREQVLSVLETQLSDEQREAFANDIINNSGTKEAALEQAQQLHELYLELANNS